MKTWRGRKLLKVGIESELGQGERPGIPDSGVLNFSLGEWNSLKALEEEGSETKVIIYDG